MWDNEETKARITGDRSVRTRPDIYQHSSTVSHQAPPSNKIGRSPYLTMVSLCWRRYHRRGLMTKQCQISCSNNCHRGRAKWIYEISDDKKPIFTVYSGDDTLTKIQSLCCNKCKDLILSRFESRNIIQTTMF